MKNIISYFSGSRNSSGMYSYRKTASGGAIAGAGVGALLGNDARSAAIGAAIGGALGAGAGELTKTNKNKNEKV